MYLELRFHGHRRPETLEKHIGKKASLALRREIYDPAQPAL